MYDGHSENLKIVTIVDRWSLIRSLLYFTVKIQKGAPNNGRYSQMVVIRRWLLTQVLINIILL
jgi:hypothetical protein